MPLHSPKPQWLYFFIATRCGDTLYWNPEERMEFSDAARKKMKMNVGCGKRPKYFVVDAAGLVYSTMHRDYLK